MGDEDDKKEETPAVDGAKEKKQVGRPDCVTPKPDLEEKGDDPDVDEQWQYNLVVAWARLGEESDRAFFIVFCIKKLSTFNRVDIIFRYVSIKVRNLEVASSDIIW